MGKNKKEWKQLDESAQSVATPIEELMLEFDEWHAMRGAQIPMQHRKEILRADFTARGLGDSASVQDFDKALESYGVKLSF